ncbi:uncharacterized protein LOC141650035 [Silene latifolia]|uniref:uncharacterized protein LOC141650035 n=1 Tax=Silene latifolia TaxID=37657 RepID=UPI003D76C0F8
MVHRIRSWGAKKLSYAGRLTLVKAVLSQLHCYWARIFLLPKGILNRVETICRNYLWSGIDGYHRIPAVSWESCCRTKKQGGLGVHNCYIWNIASISKYTWWIANKKDSLWVCWVHNMYIKQHDWWSYTPSINSSWVWHQICKVKEKLKRGLNVQQWVQGSFSTQQTYDSLAGTSESVTWEPFVWNRLCLPKVNFITWLFAKDRLLTKHRLLKFGVISDGLCCICANAQETQSHLFFDCAFSKECLQLVLQWLGISWHLHMDTIMSWRCRSLLKKQIIMASFAGLIYIIWSCRNSAKHNGSIIRPKLVLQRVQSMVKYRMQGIQSELSILRCRDWGTAYAKVPATLRHNAQVTANADIYNTFDSVVAASL